MAQGHEMTNTTDSIQTHIHDDYDVHQARNSNHPQHLSGVGTAGSESRHEFQVMRPPITTPTTADTTAAASSTQHPQASATIPCTAEQLRGLHPPLEQHSNSVQDSSQAPALPQPRHNITITVRPFTSARSRESRSLRLLLHIDATIGDLQRQICEVFDSHPAPVRQRIMYESALIGGSPDLVIRDAFNITDERLAASEDIDVPVQLSIAPFAPVPVYNTEGTAGAGHAHLGCRTDRNMGRVARLGGSSAVSLSTQTTEKATEESVDADHHHHLHNIPVGHILFLGIAYTLWYFKVF